MVREAKIEEEFYRLATNVLEKKEYVIEKVKFEHLEPQYPVDSGRADLMLPVHPSKPLLIVECKRKVGTVRGIADIRNFDPMSSRVIVQALGYAVQSGAPLFATTNGKIFALFITPERGEPFRIDRHRLLVKEMKMQEEVLLEILILIARWKMGLAIVKTPVDWAFIMRLRSFVDYLSQQLLPAVQEKIESDKTFKSDFDEFSKEVGGATLQTYSRESAYVVMNKIIFYKVLERYYGKLSKLKPIDELKGGSFMKRLNEHFRDAMILTKDFEPVFSTGMYDRIPLPDEEIVLDEINSFIEDMDTYRLEEIGSDVMGFIYERLIPDEERHRLGQFYTPPQIAELISRWCIREPTDKILDPACGSGTFLVKTYNVLKSLKPLRVTNVHKQILSQIYCIDINPFPAHLTALNLAMRDVRHPTYEMNIVAEDFFNTIPNQRLLAPFSVKSVKGDIRREIEIPYVDALIGNPPYTTWKEIPKQTKRSILHELGEDSYRYDLRPHIRSGRHPGIHMYFIMHGTRFLNEGGRLGMIISNSWLQSDIGISFGKYLLDNFKIHAVIDFSSRLFAIPLVATCVILLEKCRHKKTRDANRTIFM